jgi:GNAT superfamily N-acetyltransferase
MRARGLILRPWPRRITASGAAAGALNRTEKETLVRAGQAHAALVYEGAGAVGWCQFGTPAELPRIKNLAANGAAGLAVPDWRITRFFAGKGHRGKGVAAAALQGALDQIARYGGGDVEGFPEDAAGRSLSLMRGSG